MNFVFFATFCQYVGYSTSKYLPALLIWCTLRTSSAIFTMTPSNTDGISFAVNSVARLTCINQPYAGSQIWIFDSVKVAECGLISCVENVSNSSRFSFMNNISAGIFVFNIDHVLKTDDTKVIECYDKTVSATISYTLNVEVSGEESTASDDSLVIIVCSVGGLSLVVIVLVTFLCILCHKRKKKPPAYMSDNGLYGESCQQMKALHRE